MSVGAPARSSIGSSFAHGRARIFSQLATDRRHSQLPPNQGRQVGVFDGRVCLCRSGAQGAGGPLVGELSAVAISGVR